MESFNTFTNTLEVPPAPTPSEGGLGNENLFEENSSKYFDEKMLGENIVAFSLEEVRALQAEIEASGTDAQKKNIEQIISRKEQKQKLEDEARVLFRAMMDIKKLGEKEVVADDDEKRKEELVARAKFQSDWKLKKQEVIELEKIEIGQTFSENYEKEKRALELEKERVEENINFQEEKIKYKKEQRDDYFKDFLDQEVEVVSLEQGNVVRIISEDAEEYSRLWSDLKVYPNISGPRPNLPEELKKAGYSPEEFAEKENKIKEVQEKIAMSIGNNESFYKTDITKPSFATIYMEIHADLAGKRGTLKEILDLQIELYQKKLDREKAGLEEILKKIKEIAEKEKSSV